MRLIDADAFEVFTYTHRNNDFDDGVQYILEAIDNAPTIEPKKGKWIETDKHDIYYQPGYKCSVCGVLTTCHGGYCPNCGADMRGEDE